MSYVKQFTDFLRDTYDTTGASKISSLEDVIRLSVPAFKDQNLEIYSYLQEVNKLRGECHMFFYKNTQKMGRYNGTNGEIEALMNRCRTYMFKKCACCGDISKTKYFVWLRDRFGINSLKKIGKSRGFRICYRCKEAFDKKYMKEAW